ncbi:hypothetical protein HBH98_101630 [Parastagonospora nodorum]|nr:hypothetical protein HBH51_065470 [Parastagonospora nodorum]KAH4098680.1 hypothetical protein HBH46_156430 [Parastagonospora nodorum]KAH4191126.1 hypothetical protein HBH42_120990 [Parastagonospora nodorum]KAH4347062.1 hypothetical protein HBH98_101630 [Parastagonospora nodorum]KAH4382386.1 hypothetical protein HBH97_084740 [Parastagonospora nodorum]
MHSRMRGRRSILLDITTSAPTLRDGILARTDHVLTWFTKKIRVHDVHTDVPADKAIIREEADCRLHVWVFENSELNVIFPLCNARSSGLRTLFCSANVDPLALTET